MSDTTKKPEDLTQTEFKTKKTTVALSGISSFTGLWIANHLAEIGYSVTGLASRDASYYTGLKKFRLERVEPSVRIQHGIRIENEIMSDWIRSQTFDVWIHHHHFMDNFRSAEYDLTRANQICLEPLPGLVASLKKAKCMLVVFSGSYFEPGEALGENPSLYALSKNETWKKLVNLCEHEKIAITKIVIPNPIGPFENEDRLIPLLLNRAATQNPFLIRAPEALAVNIPISELVQYYEAAIENFFDPKSLTNKPDLAHYGPSHYRPLGNLVSNRCLIDNAVAELIVKRLNLRPPLLEWSSKPSHGADKTETYNSWNPFWNFYAGELQRAQYLPGIQGPSALNFTLR